MSDRPVAGVAVLAFGHFIAVLSNWKCLLRLTNCRTNCIGVGSVPNSGRFPIGVGLSEKCQDQTSVDRATTASSSLGPRS
jgi:hypothetical protein